MLADNLTYVTNSFSGWRYPLGLAFDNKINDVIILRGDVASSMYKFRVASVLVNIDYCC